MKKLTFLMLLALMITACNNSQNAENTTDDKKEATKPEKIEVALIEVTGMHCDGCVGTITKALQELDGVQKASVSLEQEKARVKFDPSKVGNEDFKLAIEESGYGVGEIVITEQKEKPEKESGEPEE